MKAINQKALKKALLSFELLIKTFAICQRVDSAKQNYLNKKFPTRRDAQDC